MRWTDKLLQDVRFGFRLIQRNPLLSSAVVLTLALGIGLDTAVFTAVNGILFRARVEKDPDSFVQLVHSYSGKFEEPVPERIARSGTSSLRSSFLGPGSLWDGLSVAGRLGPRCHVRPRPARRPRRSDASPAPRLTAA